jgi:hypothetical protein
LAEAVEYLPSKHRALHSNSSTANIQKKRKKKERKKRK